MDYYLYTCIEPIYQDDGILVYVNTPPNPPILGGSLGFFLSSVFVCFVSGQLSRLLFLAKTIIIRDVNETHCKTSRRSLKGNSSRLKLA